MILGLDISTSCTGWCILDESCQLIDMGFISPVKTKNLFEKAAQVSEEFSKIHINYDIKKIYVEENLQAFRPGFSSAKTLITLSRFNGIVSYLAFLEFEIEPAYINVNSARKNLGIKIAREKICGVSTKSQVLTWVEKNIGIYSWPEKVLKSGPRKGLSIRDPRSFDMADAYVIAAAGLKMNI